ncbi:MAG TPA: 30S ribosomal protein S20 [Candidatus Paceibacterota bacterium]|nr:30S ribosomal protein S20 [Candidatus Paceibacterota bacterium]
MPNIRSAHKALRQSKRRQEHNLAKKNAYKNAFKDLKKLIAVSKLEEAKQILPSVYKKIDKAAKTGVIKKNKAARLKSQATRLFINQKTP